MSLRHKIFVVIGLSGIFLTVALYFILSDIFLKSFKKLEYNYVESEILGVLDSFSGILDELKSKSADWSMWDDSYEFVQNKNPHFIEKNLTHDTFLNLKLNYIIFINQKGEFVYRHAHDLKVGKELKFPESLEKALSPGSPLLKHSETDSVHAGILSLPEGILLLVSRPVVTSMKQGPIQGSIIFARYLQDEQLRQLNRMTQHVLAVRRYNDSQLPPDYQRAKENISTGQSVYVETLSENVIAGYCLVNDIYGFPAIIVRMDQPRSIYQQSLLTMRYMILSVMLMGVSSIIVILFLLERLILTRLGVMGKEVFEIAANNNLSGRLSEAGKDELGVFAQTLNHTLARLEKVQKEIKDSEEWFRILYEYAPDAIYLNDAAKNLLDANRKALFLLSKEKEQVVGKSLKELNLLPPERLDQPQKKNSAHELVFEAPDLSPIILEVQSFPIFYKGQGLTLNIARDITERKSLEKMKEEFIFTVSHELRTPLSIVKAFLGNLQIGTAGTLNEKQSEILEISIRNVNRLTRLINDLLDISRLESGKAKLNRRACLLHSLLHETLDQFQENSKSRQIKLIRNIPDSLPTIYIDSDMIIQVVFNLLDNAFRFANSRVELKVELRQDEVEVIVIDDGLGIPPESLSLLFNRFQQINRPSGGAGYKGTGLGLVICNEIINLHQGKIWVESQKEKGAQFHFTLPLAPLPIKRENKE